MTDFIRCFEVAVHPGSVNVFRSTVPERHRSRTHVSDPEDDPSVPVNKVANFRDNRHHGKLSKSARKKLQRAIDYHGYICRRLKSARTPAGKSVTYRQVTFTLTLSSPQIHSDKEIHQHLFRAFLDQLRRRWHVEHCVWLPERQTNGNTHFHFLADRFIPAQELRDVWNNIQEKLGYVSRFRASQLEFFKAGFRFRPDVKNNPTYNGQVRSYREGVRTDWRNPPSTRIDRVYSVKQSQRYFAKYASKMEQKFDIDGRMWGCSVSLSQLTGGRSYAVGPLADELDRLCDDPLVKCYKSDHYTHFEFSHDVISWNSYPLLYELLISYIRERFPGFVDNSLF